jgi:hypothetical protein
VLYRENIGKFCFCWECERLGARGDGVTKQWNDRFQQQRFTKAEQAVELVTSRAKCLLGRRALEFFRFRSAGGSGSVIVKDLWELMIFTANSLPKPEGLTETARYHPETVHQR